MINIKDKTLVKSLLFVTLLKSCFDLYSWFEGASHQSLVFAIISLAILVWYFRSEDDLNPITSLILVTFYRAFLNLMLFIPYLPKVFSQDRLLLMNIIVFMVPSIIGAFIVYDWKKLQINDGDGFFETIKNKHFLLPIVLFPAAFALISFSPYYFGLSTLVFTVSGFTSLIFSFASLVIIAKFQFAKFALTIPLLSFLFNWLFFGDSSLVGTSYFWVMQNFFSVFSGF